MKAQKGIEIVLQCRNIVEATLMVHGNHPYEHRLHEIFDDKIIVSEEDWQELEKEMNRLLDKIKALQLSILSIYEPRIKMLEEKQGKLKTLIEHFPANAYDCDKRVWSWFEELRRLIQE